MHIWESQVRYIWELIVVVFFEVRSGSKLEVAYKIVVVFMILWKFMFGVFLGKKKLIFADLVLF